MKRTPILLTLFAFAGALALTSCESVTARKGSSDKSGRPMAQKMQKQKRLMGGY
jgi:hypothetical protein